MDITGIAKSYQAGIQKSGKPSSKKDWKMSDSLQEKITEYAREDAAQNVYMGNPAEKRGRQSRAGQVCADGETQSGYG